MIDGYPAAGRRILRLVTLLERLDRRYWALPAERCEAWVAILNRKSRVYRALCQECIRIK